MFFNERLSMQNTLHHNTTMLTYHKIFKANPSIYLSNPEPVLSCNEDFLNRLTGATNTEELHNAKVSILRDFRTIYAFDATDAELPEPIGYFADDREKCEFVKKKILLQDAALYFGSVLMFNNDLKRIVVRGCDENDKDALRWCIAKPDKRKSRKMSYKSFAELVYKEMDWDSECR